MANPFLKIDQKSGYEPLAIDDEEEVVQEVVQAEPLDEATGEPYENGAPDTPANFGAMDEVGGADPMVQPKTGAFADPVAAPIKMDAGQFGKAFYEELSNPDIPLKTPQELIEWSKTVGQQIVPDDAFYEAYRNAAAARRDKRPVPNARINSLSPEEATAQGIPFSLSEVGTVLRQAGGALPFVDEAVSAAKALPDLITGGTNAFNESYEKNWRDANTMNDLDWETREGLSMLGLGAGIVSTLFLPGPAMATRLEKVKELGRLKAAGAPIDDIIKLRKDIVSSLGKDVAVGTAIGGATGAVYGTGEGTPDDRFGKTGEGTVFGAGTGAVFQPAVVAGERLTRPLRERVAPLVDAVREKIAQVIPRAAPSSSSSVRAIARRSSADPEAMRANAARQRELGTQPALFDVTNEQGRNLVGKAGQRDGTREQLQEFTEARTTALPERVRDQAGRLSSDQRTPEVLEDRIIAQRDKDIELALNPIRAEPLQLTDEVTQILSTREGQQAINAAIGMETDPAIRANFEALRTVAKELNKIDPRLPAGARQQIMRQLMQGVNFDINASDKISRALKRRAETGEGGDARTLFQFANKVRDLARTNPRYVQAMENYGNQSKAVEAIGVGTGTSGRNATGGYLNEPADTFETQVGRLNDNPDVRRTRMQGPERTPAGQLSFTQYVDDPRMPNEFYDRPIDPDLDPRTRRGDGAPPRTQPDYGPVVEDPMSGSNPFQGLSDEEVFQDMADNVGGGQTDFSRELQRRGYSADQILDVDAAQRSIADVIQEGPSYRGEDTGIRGSSGQDIGMGGTAPSTPNDNDLVRGLSEGTISFNDVPMGDLARAAIINDGLRDRADEVFRAAGLSRTEIEDMYDEGYDALDRADGAVDPYATTPQPRSLSRAMQTDIEEAFSRPPGMNSRVYDFEPEDLARVAATTTNDDVADAIEDHLRFSLGDREAADMLARGRGELPESAGAPRMQKPYQSPTVAFQPENPTRDAVNTRAIRYSLPDGSTVTGSFTWRTGSNKAELYVGGIENHAMRKQAFGKDTMMDIGTEIHKLYPNLKFLSGKRATGASVGKARNGKGVTQTVPIDNAKPAPTEMRLARAGSASQVKREAGKGIPQAAGVARRIATSPDMQRKSTALLGEQGATDLAEAMDLELRRVNNARAQTSNQGPGRGGDDIEGLESGVNALYNPTSPITWAREAMRFMNKIGLTEKDAQFIIDNATDPKMTDQLIDQLEKAGLDQLRAKAYLDVVRNGLTRYAGTTEEN